MRTSQLFLLAAALPCAVAFHHASIAAPALRSRAPARAAAALVQSAEPTTLAGDDESASTPPPAPVVPAPTGVRGAIGSLYRFSRPHTIRGTLLACFTGVGRALLEAPQFLSLLPALLPRAMLGVLALLLGNLFIVGINQIYDVEIDEVNKPFLPIAAGRLSPRAAWAIVVAAGAGALGIVRAVFSPLIFGLFAFGTTIGGLYSVPPFQLKRFPLAAGLTIATCRGFLLNFGVYYATREALQLPFVWAPPVAFLARFMTVYAAVIAVTKDLVDVEGDKKGGIDTLALRFGPGVVAKAASAVLLLNYAAAIATALLAPAGAFRRVFMAGGHALAAVWLAISTARLRSDETASLKQYYKQIWNLFYFEYAMYPFI